MPWVNYSIGKLMAEKLQVCDNVAQVHNFLNQPAVLENALVNDNHFLVIMKSMKELLVSGLAVNSFTEKDILGFQKEWNQFNDFVKGISNESISNVELFSRVIKMQETFDKWSWVCKNLIKESWSALTDITKAKVGDQFFDFSFIIRSVDTTYYKNEMRYPIISTSLSCPGHRAIYEGKRRHVMLLYPMSVKDLIFMSVQDANTSADYRNDLMGKLLGMSFSAGDCVVIANNCYTTCEFMTYDKFRSRISTETTDDEINEILFKSTVQPIAVLYSSKAREDEISWANGYATVYRLPLLTLDCNDQRVRVIKDDDSY